MSPNPSDLAGRFVSVYIYYNYGTYVLPNVENSNFAYYALRMRSALRHYICGTSGMEATGGLQAQ